MTSTGMDDQLDELYGRVQADLTRERGPLAYLRSRTTVARVFLLAATSLATVALAGLASGAVRSLGFWVSTVALCALVSVAAASALRPLHRPAFTRGARLTIAAALVLAALVAIAGRTDGSFSPLSPGACIVMGALTGAPVFVLSMLLDRSPWRGGLFGAIAAGITGALTVQVICPARGLAHLVVEHFGIVLVCGIVFGAIGALVGRRRS